MSYPKNYRPRTTIAEQLTELRRELATRERVYPEWVKNGRITQTAATHRIRVLEDLIVRLSHQAGETQQVSIFGD